jgi:hypothetical protein
LFLSCLSSPVGLPVVIQNRFGRIQKANKEKRKDSLLFVFFSPCHRKSTIKIIKEMHVE